MPISEKKSFPREMFLSTPNTTEKRLVYIIETRKKFQGDYKKCYRNILEVLKTVQSETDPVITNLTDEQQKVLKDYLVDARNDVAKIYSQMIFAMENIANELSPGLFPRGEEPFRSGDVDFWDALLEWLSTLLDEIADVLEHLGLDGPAGLCREASDLLDGPSDVLEEKTIFK